MSLNVIERNKNSLIEDCVIHPKYDNKYNLSGDFSDSISFGSEIESNDVGYHQATSLLYSRLKKHYISKFDQGNFQPHFLQPTIRSVIKQGVFWSEILGNENPLQKFNAVIENAKSILHLDNGWDEDEGKAIDPVLFYTSSKLISDYIEAIYHDKGFIIRSPQINPVPDGSIDYEWRHEGARMLINFREESEVIRGYYYGDLKDNIIPIKGSVFADQVYEHLMKWMQYLR